MIWVKIYFAIKVIVGCTIFAFMLVIFAFGAYLKIREGIRAKKARTNADKA